MSFKSADFTSVTGMVTGIRGRAFKTALVCERRDFSILRTPRPYVNLIVYHGELAPARAPPERDDAWAC